MWLALGKELIPHISFGHNSPHIIPIFPALQAGICQTEVLLQNYKFLLPHSLIALNTDCNSFAPFVAIYSTCGGISLY